MTIITTNKALRERDKFDFYPTPYGVCDAALNLLPVGFIPRSILDPGAGSGIWGEVASQKWGKHNPSICGAELRNVQCPQFYSTWITGISFIADNNWGYDFDLVMGNPPYGDKEDQDNRKAKKEAKKLGIPYTQPPRQTRWADAEAFVRKSLFLTRSGGFVVFLLRLAFLEGQDRCTGLWRDFPPRSVHVLSARPSFITEGDKAGKTDATAYAIYLWEKGWQGTPTLGWLDWKTEPTNQLSLFGV